MNAGRTPSPAPHWVTLMALIAGVLGVHLVLLVGELPGLSRAAPHAAPIALPAPVPPADSGVSPATSTSPPVAMTRVSTVRWIVPAAPAPTQSTATPARPTPPARPPAPAPVAAVEPSAPRAEPVAQAPAQPPVVAESAPSEPMPVERLAMTDTEAPESAASRSDGGDDESTSALPDEELLAAATSKKRTPATARAQPPALPPSSTRLDYAVTGRIKGIAYNAEGRLDWTQADGRYSARMEMKVFLLGSRVQTSTGRVGPGGLSPERFADKSRSEKAAHFDAEQNRIRFSNNAPEAVLLPGAQDRLSLFLQIAGLLQARPQAYASGQTIEMQVAGTGDADIWRFKVGDESTLALPAGEMRVRQLVRLPRKEFDSTVEMWLAPELQHLPVRLRVTQASGDVADQQLSRMP